MIRLYEVDGETRVFDSTGTFAEIPKPIASGGWVREYRDHRVEWMLRSGGIEVVLDRAEWKNVRFTHEIH